jgi:SAM-dependent methyltransferase
MNLKPNDSQEIYSDPIMYDIESYHTSDIPFYLELAAKYGDPVLELACGTGRVSIPIAKAGYSVTGLDISPNMIRRAKEKAAESNVEITFLEADCRTFKLENRFRLIIMPYNAIAHIHDRLSHEALFAKVREHLHPDGCFSLSWFNPNEKYLYRDPNRRYPCMEYKLPDGTPVVITENNVYDKASQINYIRWYYKIGDNQEIVKELNMRILYPKELDALLYYNGFDVVKKYGDHNKSPFQSLSVLQVCVYRLRS